MIALYLTFRISQCGNDAIPVRLSLLYGIDVTIALTVRANAIIIPFFTIAYLSIGKKINLRRLWKTILILVLCLLVFIIPWTTRNYHYFNDFIPITDGAGLPNLKGSYFEGCPSDDDVDFDPYLDRFYEKYAYCYDESGNPLTPEIGSHLTRVLIGERAKARVGHWVKTDFKGFIYAYFIRKPMTTVNDVWFWDNTIADKFIGPIQTLYKANFVLCAAAFVICLAKKKYRAEIISLSLLYWVQTFITCLSYACERYNSMLMPIRNYIGIFAIYYIIDFIRNRKENLT